MSRLRLDLAQKLRAVGQAIEAQGGRDFEIKVRGADVLVRSSAQNVEFRLTAAEVERLEIEGRAKQETEQGMPDAYKASQVLRVVGDFLESQHYRPLRIAKTGPSVTLEFETPQGVAKKEVHMLSGLYDASIRMYLRRRSRASRA